jgi:hypothetical protein
MQRGPGLQGLHFLDEQDEATRDESTALSLHRPPSMTSEEWNNLTKGPSPLSRMHSGTPGGHTAGSSVPNPTKPSYYAASSVPGVSFDGQSTGSMFPLPPVFGCATFSVPAVMLMLLFVFVVRRYTTPASCVLHSLSLLPGAGCRMQV